MPRIATVRGVQIYMYFLDHPPPHFHAIKGDDEAVIEIGGGVIQGHLPRTELRSVLEWSAVRTQELLIEWQNGQLGRPINRVL